MQTKGDTSQMGELVGQGHLNSGRHGGCWIILVKLQNGNKLTYRLVRRPFLPQLLKQGFIQGWPLSPPLLKGSGMVKGSWSLS